MKTACAMTILICGTVLVMTPFLHDTAMASLLIKARMPITYSSNLDKDLQWAAFWVGMPMILMGMIGAFRQGPSPKREAMA